MNRVYFFYWPGRGGSVDVRQRGGDDLQLCVQEAQRGPGRVQGAVQPQQRQLSVGVLFIFG